MEYDASPSNQSKEKSVSLQTFNLTPGRISKFKGEILSHAVPMEVLGRVGRQIQMPRNVGDTYIARRWLPYGATALNANTQNSFFNSSGTGDRGQAIVQANQLQEAVTPPPDSIVPVDVTAVMTQYGCLYGFSDKTYDLYEDDIPKQMIEQIGERVTLVNEMIVYGALRGCTNVYYAGGTSINTVSSALTLGLIRRVVKGLQANFAKPVNKMLKASGNYATEAVAEGFAVYCHTDLEPDIRDLPGFIPVEQYATGTPMPGEIGKAERFRFITSPMFPAILDGGAAIGSTSLSSTSGVNIDVYPFIVMGQDAFAQISVRGKDALNPTYLPPGEKSKADPLGQRGYAGTSWYKATMIENSGWMAVGYVGARVLV